ncbi:hypothetical protein [Phytoactinopolyspora halophila]|uniref:hypothetical protein n=1 Tax=Phytoactinopolyspora halophila TaxID=1981511 RepID=UPI0013141872|nr:hypothetical protein [Phytoactinopolyspora halophila]
MHIGTEPEPIVAEDIELAARIVGQALAERVTADWTARAGQLTWSCRATLVHACDCVISYASQLADRSTSDYVPMFTDVPDDATSQGLLRVARTAAGILAAVCRDTPDDVRAFHPSGMADPEGFAAMGVAEMLVHGDDVARGLGARLDVEPDLAYRLLARLFPDVAVTGDDPWQVLLWAHGRVDLPGRAPVREWAWSAAPAGER